MRLNSLPQGVDKLGVFLADTELGLLTRGSVHHYQPSQIGQNISLTMTRPTLDGYLSGALHPIFAQNLPEGFNRRFIAERLARCQRRFKFDPLSGRVAEVILTHP